ncbi:MAG: Gfo/Idh/MocA family protein [Thermoguttaceae bacterium]
MNPTKRRTFLKAAGAVTFGSVLGTPVMGRSAEGPGRKVKIGQIGTGHAHASGKMDSLRKLTDQYEVVGIVEPDEELRRKNGGLGVYRGLRWMTEEELLNTPGLESVAVETSVPELIATASRCVDAGMHLHLDKPAGTSLAAFRRLLEGATTKGLTIQMGYMLRNNRAFELAFRAVREGWLGTVFETHGVMSKLVGEVERKEWQQMPGGTMFELGCHLIDATVALVGGKPDRVTPFARRTRPERDSVEDNMLAVLEYPRATCTVRSAIVEQEGGRRRQFVACGDRGTVDIRPLEPPQMLLALDRAREGYRKGYQEVTLPTMPGRYDDQLAELARIIRGEMESPYPPAHDLAVHETVLRAAGMPVDD